MRKSLVLLIPFLMLRPAMAATLAAANCSQAAVQAQVASAANGDTVTVPAGACDWDGTVQITGKYLTLQGAGVGQTVITDTNPKTPAPNVPQILTWATVPGGLSRLTGLTFLGGSTPDVNNDGMLLISGTSNQVRLDNLRLVPTVTAGVFVVGYVRGVIDHVTFDVSAGGGYGLYIMHHMWDAPGSDFGDTSWASPTSLGSAEAVYVEDCTFVNDQSVQLHHYGHDGWMGSRMVARHNTYVNTTWANHGTESSGRWRGQRQFEVYANTFTLAGAQTFPSVVGARGGVGVVFDNTATTSGGASLTRLFDIAYLRETQVVDTWGQCTGTNVWDENASGGYRCLDQTGVGQGDLLSGFVPTPVGWPHQAVDPTYVWNNTVNGVLSLPASSASVVQLGRDFLTTPRPGYTPYVYPHPLVTGMSHVPAPTVMRRVYE